MTKITSIPYNLCTRFLLPLLQLDNLWLCKSTKNRRRLVNCFITTDIGDNELQKEDRLYLLIQSHDFDKDYDVKLDKITSHPLCCSLWELDLEYTLIAFNMSVVDDYYKFINGKYSEYSEKGQRLCIGSPFSNAYINKSVIPIVQHIFNKKEERKQYISELFKIPVTELNDCELAPIYSSPSEEIGTNILNNYILDKLNIKITVNN